MENNARIWAEYIPAYVSVILGVMQGQYIAVVSQWIVPDKLTQPVFIIWLNILL